jgi:DNA-binding response OmpR family regulator
MDARLLVVGSPSFVALSWVDDLVAAGAQVEVVGNGTDALRHLELLQPDVVLIDVHLPGPLDGFDTCRAIRSRSTTLVVFATSCPAPFDEVVALAVGGDHFFESETPVPIVIARLRSLLRRTKGLVRPETVAGGAGGADGAVERSSRSRPRDRSGGIDRTGHSEGVAGDGEVDGRYEHVTDGDLEIDIVAREVRVNGELTDLTRIEFDLLVTLARSPRRVFTREQLMASAWDQPFDGSHVLDSHLSRLRRKIDGAGGERVAHSVRGVGYRLRD